ncbi:MAG TPA: tetratricopeptide repeat protein [Stellaceae bacterium]|jgi:predicted O-linked N-acetylglucosamine transferase (SPINDLY family)|nr:tetratricopeptide repeat protein [Stellaceae bacterium]
MSNAATAKAIGDALRHAARLRAEGRSDEAARFYQTILAVQPTHQPALRALGGIALRAGNHELAAACLGKAAERKKDDAGLSLQLAQALTALGRTDEAVSALQRVLRLKPKLLAAQLLLGANFGRLGQADAAIAHFRRALQIDPACAEAHVNLGSALLLKGSLVPAVEHYRRALALAPENLALHANFVPSLNYLPEATNATIAAAAQAWGRLVPRHGRSAWRGAADPERRLRIGYISADLGDHPVAYFLESVLAAADRAMFEITCYSNRRDEDATSARLRRSVDHWRPIHGHGDESIATAIRQDGIDILVDLSGHTAGNRLAVFADRPAPVQCSWLGYFGTTGLAEIDYIIADRFAIPPGEEGFYSEAICRLPDSYLCFTPPPDIRPAAQTQTVERPVTFGCFNNILKINPAVVAAWSAILAAVPDSRLLLKTRQLDDPALGRALAEQFAAHGIAGERICCAGGAPRAALLAAYGDVDIALDPFPYGGGTTTIEALWMGVPVISLRGDRFTARVGDSILTTAGLPELVAGSVAGYVARASALARDRSGLAALRAGLRDRLAASPLCDAPRFARNLEAAYRRMWRDRCSAARAA